MVTIQDWQAPYTAELEELKRQKLAEMGLSEKFLNGGDDKSFSAQVITELNRVNSEVVSSLQTSMQKFVNSGIQRITNRMAFARAHRRGVTVTTVTVATYKKKEFRSLRTAKVWIKNRRRNAC